jgi:hypothetical protein
MKLAKWIFLIAGIFGVLVTIPMALAEKAVEQIMPPAVHHPEFFYGFVLLNACWQVLYLFLSTDPIRYRPMMIPSFAAKASGVVALSWLLLQGRISDQWTVTIFIDGIWALLFVLAFWTAGRAARKRERLDIHRTV